MLLGIISSVILNRQRIILEGDVPSPIKPPAGCRFHPRCKYAKAICSQEEPELEINESVFCERFISGGSVAN